MMLDFDTFFQEKDIPFTEWEIEYDGQIHYITSDVVIEAILSSRGQERTQIAGVLFKLDFHNAPILDYLKHLATCMIKHRFEGKQL